jgi:FixJ family two-component response regulator
MAEQIMITIVDDEQDMRESISQWLSLSGYKTVTYASADLALKNIDLDYPGIIISLQDRDLCQCGFSIEKY